MSILQKILDVTAPTLAWSRRLRSDDWLKQMSIFLNWRLFDEQKALDDESIAAIQRHPLAVRNQMAKVLMKRIRGVADSVDRRIAARQWLIDEARAHAQIYSIFVDEDRYDQEVAAGARHPLNYGLLSVSHQIVAEAVPDLVKKKGSVEGAAQSLREESHWLYTRLYLAIIAVVNLEEEWPETASWIAEYIRLLVAKSEIDLRLDAGIPIAADEDKWREVIDGIDRKILAGERNPVALLANTLVSSSTVDTCA